MPENLKKYLSSIKELQTLPTMMEHLEALSSTVSRLGEKIDGALTTQKSHPDFKNDGIQVQRWWLDQLKAGKLIQLEYPVIPQLRRAPNESITPKLGDHVRMRHAAFAQTLSDFSRFKPQLEAISLHSEGGAEPSWINPWIPALDGISLYAFVAEKNPKTYMEIGSGVSTTFVRRAIKDHNLQTKIVSIDPFPRAEIDGICDEVIRVPLEQCDLSAFDRLEDGDVLFCDNSHRGFQNSDVTVFFSEVVPLVSGKNVLIGVHDIFLPFDYPKDWLGRHYNEQYYMIGSLLADAWDTVLPCFYCVTEPELKAEVAKIAEIPMLKDGAHRPAIYWFTQK